MSLEQARQAQASAARTRREREAPTEYVIRDGRIQPSVRTVDWKWPLAGAVAILGAGVVIGWLILGDDHAPAAPGEPVAGYDPPRETMTMDTGLDTSREQFTTAAPTTPAPATAAQATPGPAMQVTPEPEPEPEPAPPTAAQAAPAPAAQARPEPEPEAARIGAPISPGIDYEPGITDARVARAQVTTAVVGREPVDTLGPVLVGTGEDIQTYYFFTELRSLAGQRVRHRWIAGDRVQAEIPFDVGEAWRWRVFSSKRMLAGMAGPWRVQVMTGDDTVIYDYAFEFQP